jgi:TetR/AcrR family transcriptional regulator, transcriptional repressor for nem operon
MTKGQLTRQKIIEQAAPLFNRSGYSGCSMQDIMTATGLEKGGLYRHFASKEELAAEAFRYSVDLVNKARREGLEKVEGAVEKLRFMIRRFVEIHSLIPGGCPVMNTAIEADDGNPALRQLAQEAVQEWKSKITGIVKAGVEQGSIRGGTEPRRVANVIVAALEGALMISRLEGHRTAIHDAQSMLETMLHDLETHSARRARVKRH